MINKRAKSKSPKKILKKNKYNIAIWLILALIAFFVISKAIDFYQNRDLVKYDNNILVIEHNGVEEGAFTLSEIRKLGSEKVEVTSENKSEKITIEGVNVLKIFDKLNIDPTQETTLSFKDNDSKTHSIPMSFVLEPKRVYLVFRINGKQLMEYNKDLGVFAILDTQNAGMDSRIKDIERMEI